MTETLILVDARNRAIGCGEKRAVHEAGLRHRAFSIFLVDAAGRLLLQRRAASKYHSGGLWANSCCGHPRCGEPTRRAAERRLREELGARVPLTFQFHARYRAELDHGLTEDEFVYLYFGRAPAEFSPDPAEVAALEWTTLAALEREIGRKPGRYAVWLRRYLEDQGPSLRRALERFGTRPGAGRAAGQSA